MNEQRDELAAAFRRTEALGNEKIGRQNWTTNQWVDDAERIMGHIDGASSALLNGHINALLRMIRSLREAAKPRIIAERYGDEGIESLAACSIILSNGISLLLQTDGTWLDGLGSSWDFWEISLPATVLYAPTPGGAE